VITSQDPFIVVVPLARYGLYDVEVDTPLSLAFSFTVKLLTIAPSGSALKLKPLR
jgi:hypothetical protein